MLGIQSTNIAIKFLPAEDGEKEKPIVEYGSRVAYDDRVTLLEYQKRNAAEGNAEAQFGMGMRFLNGIDVERNERLARDFLEQASRNGNLRAREKLRELRK